MRKPPFQVLFIALATALVLPGDSILYAVLPTYYGEIGLTPIEVGVLLSANRWVRLASNSLAERAFHRHGVQGWLVAALLLGSAVMVAYGTATAFSVLLLARIGWGISFSFLRQAGIMTVVRVSEGRHLLQHMGYLRGFTALGGIAGVLLGGLGHDLFGFSTTLFGFFALSLAAAPLGYFSQKRLAPPEPPAAESLATVGFALASPRLMFCGFVVGMVGPGLVSSTLGLVVNARAGEGVALGGVVLGAATLSGIMLAFRWTMDGVAAPVLGALADRWGGEHLTRPLFLLGAAALVVAGLPTGVAGIAAGTLLLFFCGTFLGVLLTSRAGIMGPRTVSAYVTAQDFGSAIGPLVGWSVAQAGLESHWIFFAGSAAYLLAMSVAMKAR